MNATRRLIEGFALYMCIAVAAFVSPGSLAQPSQTSDSAVLDIGDCPSNLRGEEYMVNKTYVCSCGKDISYGEIYGTELYSSNSNICTAALHAGVLKKGEPGQVEFETTASPPVFRGTTRNGIKSLVIPHPYNSPYGPGAYRIRPAQKDTSEAH